MSVKRIHILGVTGSVGESAVDVILRQPACFDVCVVSAYSNVDKLAALAQRLQAKIAVIGDERLLPRLRDCLDGTGIQARCDLCAAMSANPVDITLAAIIGVAGLEPLMAAIAVSDAVAIANKEPLVAAGPQVMAAAHAAQCRILPVDSEHNAIYQVFDPAQRGTIDRIVLTASGGAFREWTPAQMRSATKAQALKHPNWSMGQKITIDSATMMNKALEIIEAAILFALPPEKIDVLIHPQSVVHGMVEYCDGSVLAQMGASDMRTPLANILGGGEARLSTPGKRLDLTQMSQLDFYAPDTGQFPALTLAYEALSAGQYACIALNAANEVAVEAFLSDDIGFLEIVDVNRGALAAAPRAEFSSVESVIAYDGARRRAAKQYIDDLRGAHTQRDSA